MAEEIELIGVQDIPVEEGAGIDADNAEDVVIDFSWLSSMEKKLASTYGPNSSPSFTICRVPANIRECDHAAYKPRIVSIGPFHRGRENLHAMEEHKWRCLHKVVLPFGVGRNNLEKFLKKMKEIETEARICYSENIQMSSNEFVEMMVLDGCFIIFLILHKFDFVDTDNERMSRLIHLDMILLENQLPFFVLECLWELIGLPRDALTEAALASFECFSSYRPELKRPEEHLIHHLLHLLHLSFRPDSLSESKHESPPRIPSATELLEAGVRFRLKRARSFIQVRFTQGLMEMPCLWIYDDTHIPFRNLMAFEQCFPKWGNHFTTYCLFIDFLVHTPRDVSILRNAGIIRTGLESDEEVALLFNKLGKEIVWSGGGTYLADLFKKVDQHTRKSWPKWRAKMVHDFFSGPTKLIKFTSAGAILVLTCIQTYFSVVAYFSLPKS